MATTSNALDLLASEMAKSMAEHTKTKAGRTKVQNFLASEYPQFKVRHVLMVVNYHELRGSRGRNNTPKKA